MVNKAGIYVRTSTLKQDDSLVIQEEKLRNYCKAKGYEVVGLYKDEGFSGATTEARKELERLMKDAERGEIDIVIVTDLDRFARSTKDLLDLVERLNIYGAKLAALNQPIDTSTMEGELFITILGAIAEFEKKLILRRLSVGRERAKKEGKNIHKRKIDIPLKKIEEYLKKGLSCNAIAKIFNVSVPSIHDRVTKELGYVWVDYRWIKKE